jgi:hypothetical protein
MASAGNSNRFAHSKLPAAYVVEEQFIDPGEELFVIGQVQQVQPDSTVQVGYRQQPTVPVISGSSSSPLVIYSGNERTLLASLRREKLYLRFITAAGAALAAGLLGAAFYLASL